ncbi:MAG: DUF3021 family protein [Oscillospiraceae bacterium]
MKFLKSFVGFFSTITTCILIVCAVNFFLSGGTEIPGDTLFQILLSGFATALVTAVFYYREIKTQKQFLIIITLHYVLLCGIMIGLGVWFGWMDFDLGGIIMMLVSVAVVYALTMLMNYIVAKKDADDINRMLEQMNRRRK